MVVGYKQSQEDHMLFIKYSPLVRVTPLLVYVDDTIVKKDDDKER